MCGGVAWRGVARCGAYSPLMRISMVPCRQVDLYEVLNTNSQGRATRNGGTDVQKPCVAEHKYGTMYASTLGSGELVWIQKRPPGASQTASSALQLATAWVCNSGWGGGARARL
eukprot:12720449-Alexandrium_andersonii.AAC.3